MHAIVSRPWRVTRGRRGCHDRSPAALPAAPMRCGPAWSTANAAVFGQSCLVAELRHDVAESAARAARRVRPRSSYSKRQRGRGSPRALPAIAGRRSCPSDSAEARQLLSRRSDGREGVVRAGRNRADADEALWRVGRGRAHDQRLATVVLARSIPSGAYDTIAGAWPFSDGGGAHAGWRDPGRAPHAPVPL